MADIGKGRFRDGNLPARGIRPNLALAREKLSGSGGMFPGKRQGSFAL